MTAKEALWVFKKRTRCSEFENCGYRHTKCDFWVGADELKEAERKAVEALEKQVPKKPNEEVSNDEIVAYWLGCPICGSVIGYKGASTKRSIRLYGHTKFCGKCGQAIDWKENEKNG